METKENQTKNENIHKDHRKRLIKTVMDSGLENMDEIKKVELFLFFILPRVDTNPIAHALLDKFGSFSNIIEADMEELRTIKGLSQLSSQKIKLFQQMFLYFAEDKVTKKRLSLNNQEQFLKLLEGLMRFKTTENLYLFAFDHKLKLLAKRKYDLNSISQIGISPSEIFAFISSSHANSIIFAHNHPGGTARPSQNDINATKFIENLCRSWDCSLLNSVIVGVDGIYSIVSDGFLEKFDDNLKILQEN